jgi:hypothetical protein
VENPCAILDQENAKKFIKGSEQEKYHFFKTGTDLDKCENAVAATLVRDTQGRTSHGSGVH